MATDAVALDTDTRGVDVQSSENATADSFGKNLVFAWCESRYATSVFSPLGVVSLDLTAKIMLAARRSLSSRDRDGRVGRRARHPERPRMGNWLVGWDIAD